MSEEVEKYSNSVHVFEYFSASSTSATVATCPVNLLALLAMEY